MTLPCYDPGQPLLPTGVSLAYLDMDYWARVADAQLLPEVSQ